MSLVSKNVLGFLSFTKKKHKQYKKYITAKVLKEGKTKKVCGSSGIWCCMRVRHRMKSRYSKQSRKIMFVFLFFFLQNITIEDYKG